MILSAKDIFKANIAFVATLLVIILFASPANAKMYKWVDKEGVTHYTQQPPVTENSTVMTEHSKPATKEPHTSKTSHKHATAKKPGKAAKDAKKARQCAHVKKNLEMLEKSLNIVRKRVKGKLVAMSEIERKQLIGQYRATISQHCQ